MKTMTEEKAFLLMEEQGWHPMPCDTPVPVYDVPASCGLPTPVGNETNDVTMLPKDFVKSMDAFVIRAIAFQYALAVDQCHHDVAVVHLCRLVDKYEVAVNDVGANHRIALRADEESIHRR